jgi:hypothetical protein
MSLRIPRGRTGASAQKPDWLTSLPAPVQLPAKALPAGTIIDRAARARQEPGRDPSAGQGVALSPARTDPGSADEIERAADGQD